MNTNEIRVKVAELCGWKWWKHDKSETYLFCHPSRDKASLDDEQFKWDQCADAPDPKHFVSLSGVPNYPESLDACAEFERDLRPTELWEYTQALRKELTDYWSSQARKTDEFRDSDWSFAFATATPLQRCQAFLKVKGIK